MQSLSEIRALLAERGLRPKKNLGQNFLIDKNQLGKLVAAADVRAGDLVLEVGPGTGTLTETLVDVGAEVVACELDRDMAGIVADRLGERVRLIEGDCLERGRRLNSAVVEALGDRPFKLVANLPYQAASPLMCALLLEDTACTGQYVTIQKEVADRIAAPPGGKAYGPLTVIVQAFADVQRIAVVKPASFWPPPQVDSAMVSIVPKTDPPDVDRAAFARFVTELFSKRRKQLGSILPDMTWPDDIDPKRRPETLSIVELLRVFPLS